MDALTLTPGTMKTQETIASLMTPDPVTIDLYDSLDKANRLFTENKIRHLPVVNGDDLVGMLSYTDILRMSFGNTFDQSDMDDGIFDMLHINQVMKHSPVTVSTGSSIKEAGQILADKEFHALPVMDDGKLVGIITTTDIIKFFLTQL